MEDSRAEAAVKKYNNNRAAFSTPSQLRMIASLTVPLSPFFSVRVSPRTGLAVFVASRPFHQSIRSMGSRLTRR